MSLQATATLSLASATLAGGARLASSGGGLPARITTASDITIAAAHNVNFQGNHCFSQDSAYLWIGDRNINNTIRYAVSDGSVATTLTNKKLAYIAPSGDGATMFGGMWDNGTTLYQLNWDGTANQSATCVASTFQVAQGSLDSSTVWTRVFGSNTITQYNWPAMTATGNTVTGPASTQNFQIINVGGVDYIFAFGTTQVKSYQIGSLTTIVTWTLGATNSTQFGDDTSGAWLSGIVDTSGRPLVSGRLGNVDRYLSTGGTTFPTNFDTRVMWGGDAITPMASSENAGVGGIGTTLAFSPNGNLVAYSVHNSSRQLKDVRISTIGTQTAQWSNTFSAATTIRGVLVPGKLGNATNGSTSYARTILQYSTDGSSWTAFTEGAPLAVAIGAGGTFYIRATLSLWMMPPSFPPYIGGDSGEGIQLIYDSSPPAGVAFNTGFN